MIHTDGKPTIAMRESDSLDNPGPRGEERMKDPAYSPDKNYFREFQGIPDGTESHFLLVEVEGEIECALDLRAILEKLEYPGIGMTSIHSMEAMAVMQAARVSYKGGF